MASKNGLVALMRMCENTHSDTCVITFAALGLTSSLLGDRRNTFTHSGKKKNRNTRRLSNNSKHVTKIKIDVDYHGLLSITIPFLGLIEKD